MADRRRQIEQLLATRLDFDFTPETFTGKVVKRGAVKGKGGSPSHWQTCDRCNGDTTITDRFGRQTPCPANCSKGRVRVDDYTGDRVITGGEGAEPTMTELLRKDTRYVRCPDCQDLAGTATGVVHGKPCRRCSGTGEAPIAGSWLTLATDTEDRQPGDAIDAMLNALERRDKAGSYRHLDEALAGISKHVNKPPVFLALTVNAVQAKRLLDDVYTAATRDPADLSMFEGALVELALTYIDWRMPEPIRVPAGVVQNAKLRRDRPQWVKGSALSKLERERRDKQIRLWEREGKPRQWIGAQTGLNDRQLREIINGARNAA